MESNYSKLHYSKLHFKIVYLHTGEDLCFDLCTGKMCFFCFFAYEPLDFDFGSLQRSRV